MNQTAATTHIGTIQSSNDLDAIAIEFYKHSDGGLNYYEAKVLGDTFAGRDNMADLADYIHAHVIGMGEYSKLNLQVIVEKNA